MWANSPLFAGALAGGFGDIAATGETIVDGWLKTGDMGFVDRDGFLTITDRKKDLIKTSGGKYVAPLPLESQIENDRYVKSSLVVGDAHPFVVALIVPDWQALIADMGWRALRTCSWRAHACRPISRRSWTA